MESGAETFDQRGSVAGLDDPMDRSAAVMARNGLTIAEIPPEEFREFAKRYATSPEIGPVQTSLDDGIDKTDAHDRVLIGLGDATPSARLLVSIFTSRRGTRPGTS